MRLAFKKCLAPATALLFCTGMMSCGTVSGAGSGTPSDLAQPFERVLSIADIYSSFGELKGKTVTVAGKFMGWNRCSGRTGMKTRSDWMLSDGTACIYVTGGFPHRLDPLNKSHAGKDVRFRAQVLGNTESVYLRLISQ